jgi:hypothetical protein
MKSLLNFLIVRLDYFLCLFESFFKFFYPSLASQLISARRCFIRSLPGAIGMYALALGVSRISSVLPLPVYALLSGLNAAVVGNIALAAVQLANKAITDPLSRLILIFSACAGLCYNALWYFPVLMAVGGTSTLVWDLWARSFVGTVKSRWRRRRSQDSTLESSGGNLAVGSIGREDIAEDEPRRSIASVRDAIRMVHLRRDGNNIDPAEHLGLDEGDPSKEGASERSVPEAVTRVSRAIPVKMGIAILVAFFGTFWWLRTMH